MFLEERIASITRELAEIKTQQAETLRLLRGSAPANVPTPTAPITSAKQLKEWTGWPDGTFYQKVSEMPDGVVIRGKSKRLLFDTEKLMAWLKTPVQL
jgi:hypothetical protein